MAKITQEEIPQLIKKHMPEFHMKSIQTLKGLSNQTFFLCSQKDQKLLFRIFMGSADRQIENIIFLELAQCGIAPKCYYACQQFRIEGFVQNGIHPTNLQLREDQNLVENIMKKMHQFHQIKIKQTKQQASFVDMFITSEKILKSIINLKVMNEKFKQLQEKVLQIIKQPQYIRKKYVPLNQDTFKFCHNDLNNLNLFNSPQGIILIDFEYASYNHIAYDIANFLNQSTINYSISEYPAFFLQKKLTKQQIYKKSKFYPQSYVNIELDVVKCLCLCNIYWSIWCLQVAQTVKFSNFCAIEHGFMRIQLFKHYNNMLKQINDENKLKKQ